MMDLGAQNILFFSRSTQHGGTEKVIVQLCKILKPKVNKIVVCSAKGFDVTSLTDMGIRHYQIPDIENKSLKTVMTVLRRVNKIIEIEEITLIHTHHRMAAFYTFLLSNKHNFYFVNTSHNTFTNKVLLTKLAYSKAHLVSCGEMVKKNLVCTYGINEEKITTIHNAVEEYIEEVIPEEQLLLLRASGHILIGNVGRLSEQKGMEYFIDSLPEVLKVYPNVKYIIVGDGEDKKKLEYRAKQLNVAEDVLFLGFKKNIQNIMKQLDFIVLSSLWEGLPLTPIEAYSVGKTVIATGVDGTLEVIRDGVDGLLIEPRNSEQIAEKVLYLIANANKREQFEIEAKNRYLQEFSFAVFRNAYLKYYGELE